MHSTDAGTESLDVEVPKPDNNSSVHDLDSAPTQPAQATEAATPNTQTGFFPFLKLPRELRDQIYHHAVVYHRPMHIQRSPEHNFKHQTPTDKPPETISIPLARVSKQLNAEVIPLLYAKNTFFFSVSHHMRDFLTHFAPHTNLIRRIIVEELDFWDGHMRNDARVDQLVANLNCLLPLEDLESLRLEARFEAVMREDALSMFMEGIRGWAEAVGERAGDRYKALEIIRESTLFAVELQDEDSDRWFIMHDMLQDEMLEGELRDLF